LASNSYVLRSTFRLAVVQAVTVLLCFGSGALLDHLQHVGPTIVILPTVLGLTIGRTQRHGGTRQRLVSLVTLSAVSVACAEVGRLFVQHPDLGDTLFTAVIGFSIWMRRFPGSGRRLAALIALPFITLFITPVTAVPGASPSLGRTMLWSAIAAVIAFCSVWVTRVAAERIGYLPPLPEPPRQAAARPAKVAAKAKGGISPNDRMAIQMVLSLAIAFSVGRAAFSPHWTWIVLTAFIVNSGNRGRGDVVYKCLQRIAGAAVGTVVATLVSGLLPPRDNTAIVIILAVIIIAAWLRTVSYAYWAGCVTGVLSLLQGYFGEGSVGLLGDRLLQILLGGALAVAIAWFVLPVKSTHSLRSRIAGSLTALTDTLRAAQRAAEHAPGAQAEFAAQHRRLRESVAQLKVSAPSFVAHRRLNRIRRIADVHPADAVDALLACAEPMSVLAQQAEHSPQAFAEPAVAGLLRAVLGNVVGARRYLGAREGARYREPGAVPEDTPVVPALYRIDEAARVISELYRTTYARAPKLTPQPLKA
jgi:hypothetical protein